MGSPTGHRREITADPSSATMRTACSKRGIRLRLWEG